MNNDIDLTNQLRRLAAVLPNEAGPDVERELMAAFRARSRRRSPLWIYAAAAALACLAFLVGLKVFHHRPLVGDSVYAASGFIALPYSQSGVPMESAVVIRVQIRPSELTSMGVAVPAEPASGRFQADLLVGQDGVPRAVRLVE